MKAVLSKEVGGPETLVVEDIAAPEAGPGNVVIDVKAVGAINVPEPGMSALLISGSASLFLLHRRKRADRFEIQN